MRQVLALQHVWDDPPAYLAEILHEHEIACDTIEVENEPMPNPTPYQAILLLGGPQHVYADQYLPYLAQEKMLLRQAVAENIPILGICLGGQLLASALGAEVRRNHTTEIGFFQIPLTAEGSQDPLFAGLPGAQFAFHWHEDVFELPSGAIRLAQNEDAPNQAFRYGEHAYGLQFHIELNTKLLNIWLQDPTSSQEIIQLLGDQHAPTRLAQEWSIHAATYQRHTRILFENFLRIAGFL